jgi:NhaP-type Na+/H+ or K+/H+ antiporter
MGSVFPRGIVAVSLATYYATQIPAWGLHGGGQLAGILFLVVVFTIAISTPLSIFLTMRLRLQLPSVVIAGITPATLETARKYKQTGHLPLLVDTDVDAVAFARSHDLDAAVVDADGALVQLVRERRAKFLIIDTPERWASSAPSITVLTPSQAQQLLAE